MSKTAVAVVTSSSLSACPAFISGGWRGDESVKQRRRWRAAVWRDIMKVELVLCVLFSAFVAAFTGCNRPQAAHGGSASARVAFENDRVRVIEYHTGSEKAICGFGVHTHPPHVYIMLTDAKIRIVTPDGKETFENAKAGDVGWAGAEHHIAENILGNNAGCYVIEIKDKDWTPSTGLTRE